MEELLSLKWNNHRSTFLHILGVLRDKQSYTDVTLACDGKFYSVHKLVLSTCSDYFCAMFEKTSCKSPVIVLKDIKSEDLEALLDYMYLGEVNVRQSDLASLIKAAENLRIKGLAVPDDEPPPKRGSGGGSSSVGAPSRRDSSPPAKRKRRDESEDGREDVRPGGDLHTPPPAPPSSRPKSPGIQRLSPSPHRTAQESHATEERDNRPHSSPAETSSTPHSQAQVSQPAQQLSDPSSQTMSNQYRGDNPPFVKVEVTDEETDGANRESYDLSSESFKEESDVGGEIGNDLPEFLQQAASSALAGTSASYHQSFAGPSGFQPEVSSWHGDGQSMPGNFPGMTFPTNTSQENPPGIGAELHGNVCKVCGKVFNGRNWKQNLEYHSLTHTKEKPYKCPICPHSSALKYNLIRHIRNRHWEVLAPTLFNANGDRERERTESGAISNWEGRSSSNQESYQTSTEKIIEIAAQLSANLSSQNQNQLESNLNSGFPMTLQTNQEALIPTAASNNSQAIQIVPSSSSSSSNPSVPVIPGGLQPQDQLSQMIAHLNPLNLNLEMPLSSGNQEMPIDHDMQLSSETSQENSVFMKGGNQILKKHAN